MSFFQQYVFDNLLWTQGVYILLVTLVCIALGVYLSKFLLILATLFLLFSIHFFRNPTRTCPELVSDPHILVCPSDGRVVAHETVIDATLGEVQKISIFLSPLDVHVNWVPVAGVIESVTYRPGKFVVAYAPKSSDINERNDIVIKTLRGDIIRVRQIAGLIARRICCWVKPQGTVTTGQKYGMIRFGSRVDVFLPLDIKVAVTVGQYVYGGQTVLGR